MILGARPIDSQNLETLREVEAEVYLASSCHV